MVLRNPAPFNKERLAYAPLDGTSGSDFPCKFNDAYGPSPGDASNVYAQGSTQKLEFTGQATHGGGSCQVSLTTDLKPTKSSSWKVIKSIQGGCVAKNTPGNMGNDPNAKDPFTYDFTIPKDLASGNYTLAWTWFNRVGNREMYMNCAPISVTGSGGSQSFLNGLPDMFVANIGNGCETVENADVVFPDPGKDVDNFGGPNMSLKPGSATKGNCKVGAGGAGGAGGAAGTSQSAPTAAAQPISGQNPQPTAPADDVAIPGGIFIENPQAGDAPNSNPASGSSPAPPGATGSSSTGGSGSTSEVFASGTACSGDVWNCIGGTSFQRCASGAWSAPQPVAAGTSCSPGQANGLKTSRLSHAKKKRSSSRAIRFSA
ncbi:hypothetical protein E4U43_001074 [Claviceps pusilla]|uniref:Auxiliary Activity family 9 catalytic domain-containing protein n=1 Tax=Claviceps pusilla TaxID=123648 RepID=A0A9P7NH44_9HYPO|nr:hypothetical protein E4U43_001074 [Claviceps pusilla]